MSKIAMQYTGRCNQFSVVFLESYDFLVVVVIYNDT
jgi:hypothetical protein